MSNSRKLFEEVGAETPARAPRETGLIDKGRRGARGAIRIWLMMLFVLVMAMIVVGGLTRLTDSGLSITEWAPVSGALPPMSEAAWQSEFDKYRQIPEYQLQNVGMSMAEFKFIYWWEWGHRQLGRFVGLVWALGFVGFLVTRKIPPGWTGRLLLLGGLGGLQGAIGWWMVASGLTGDRIDVASYRLATHLGLAFVILGVIAWFTFQLGRSERDLMQQRRVREGKLFSMSTGLMHFTFLQILLGALVAGIDAGRNYTDWPLMAGEFLPPTPLEIEPVWRNFFENSGTVQFMHRMAGYGLMIFGVVVWLRARRSPNAETRFRFNAVLAMMVVQMVLGIVTVIYGAPLEIAIVHQLGAVLLWVLVIRARFGAGYPKSQSLRGTA
ncbi:Heme A synthase [Roseivivax sp. THAF40]|uniref:heme A synthase n=1 Tax=unclassified Roseivivax TaxID=2639302 RepID=UPI0012681444|nr:MULTISPECIES: heme A synthase [unclassified Roseivivax]QFS82274.1 Heme A synthase [Roseivivax sp. THAF197b]QFT46074.1 Heme A synthase [Roseivivax sp. THAF40]